MKNFFACRAGSSGAERGAALIIILAFLVLLTGIVAIFLSRALIGEKVSTSSANRTKSDILARSAVDMVTGDLKQEITQYSTNVVVGTAPYLSTNYFPMTATNMAPMRSGNPTFTPPATDPIPNLVRRSVRSDTLPIPSRASAVNSATDLSYNGRSVSLARWNSHYLIPRLNAGSATIDSTPIASFTAPDWVIVTKNGPTVLTAPDQSAIGRYAYAIYDEGGLLDANVAGYPSSMTATLPSQLGGKGSLALADLTAIGLTTSDIDNLVGWRNYASTQPTSGSFGSYNFGADINSATNYYDYVTFSTNSNGFTNAPTGFLTVNPQSYNNQTDQIFTSRQALLKFQRAISSLNSSTGFTQDALQYLGTFSRDLEQPSFIPDFNLCNPVLAGVATAKRPKNTSHAQFNPTASSSSSQGFGGNDTYDTTGAKQDQVNPSLLTVRDALGQPVLKRRFPLSRLSLMEQAGVTLRGGGTLSSTQATQILQYFGLVWDQTNSQWLYVSPDGSSSATTPASTIKTLAQIAAITATNPKREPDFFETLYAVICCDSLGKQYGGAESQNASGSWSPHIFTNNAAAIDGSVEFQIMQIGANLMDQYDVNSFPTCIAFSDTHSGFTRQFYGVENLPYLEGWMQSWYRMKKLVPGTDYPASGVPPNNVPPTAATIGSGSVYETWTMVQPIIWNPHVPNPNLNTSQIPTKFRVVACSVDSTPPPATPVGAIVYPQVRPSWWTLGLVNTYPTASGTFTTTSFCNATVDGVTSYIQFSSTPNTVVNSSSDLSSFQEPYRLLYNYPPGSSTAAGSNVNSSYVAGGVLSNGAFSLSNYGTIVEEPGVAADATDGKTIIGFFAGKCWTGASTYSVPAGDRDSANGEKPNCLVNGSESDNLQLRLQYQTAGGTWLTYDVIYDAATKTGNPSTVDNVDTAPNVRGFRTALRADARTDRWGLLSMNTFPLATNPSGITGATADGVNLKSLGVYNFPQGITLNPIAGFTTGSPVTCVYRPSPESATQRFGWPTSTTSFGDVMVNVNTGASSSAIPGNKTYYSDADGVIRRASGAFFSSTTSSQNDDSLPLHTGNNNSRPVVLNRHFQSVAEMGYAFSGTPWKDLSFLTPESGDAALLDAFCLNETPNSPPNVTVAGKVNLNTRQTKVLQALIQGVSKAEGGIISNTEAANASAALVNWTSNTTASGGPSGNILTEGPLRNRSELVGKFISQVANGSTTTISQSNTPAITIVDGSQSYSGFSSMLTSPGVFTLATDAAIKRRRECVVRALADSGNTRTWNLLIDVIAQTGRYPAGATALSQFVVTGETRYWVHVAIDRYTGNIIDESFEPVSE